MKSFLLLLLMGMALFLTGTATAGTSTSDNDSTAAQAQIPDSLSLSATPSSFQISKAQPLPDSLIHFNSPSFFGGLFPKTKQEYTRRGLLTTAILTNWVSFYLKRRADDYYGKYRRASNIRKLTSYYNQTAEFDRFSNAMLLVSGVALTAYLYFIFSD